MGTLLTSLSRPRPAPRPVPMPLPLFRLDPHLQRPWIAERLARPAPPAAVGLSDGFRLPGREGHAMPAAVLVPLVNRPAGLTVLLTERSRDLPDHPGQISFPGGRIDPGDDERGRRRIARGAGGSRTAAHRRHDPGGIVGL